MAAVQLQIVQPVNGTVFTGINPVTLAGQVLDRPAELAGVPLYYRWYSNLFPAEEDRYSIHPDALSDPAMPFAAELGPGTHVITLAAGDQPGEDQAAQNATRHGGVTGGSEGAGQCIISVLTAVMLAPSAGATLSKAESTLEARAPLLWEAVDYQTLNRLRYRWRFTPAGPPSGRAAADLFPAVDQLEFDAEGPLPLVRYRGALPDALDTGSYTLTLRVEDTQDANLAHTVSRNVQIVA